MELAWPVTDAAARQRIIDECLVGSLHDGRDAWDLQADGCYRRVEETVGGHSVQVALMRRHGALGPWT